ATSLGMESVSVFAVVDALALHTRVTTKSVAIGKPTDQPVQSYLDIEALIAAAKSTDCDSVHPGYGFLSEKATFAQRCRDEGLAFIGPSPETLSLFGDKTMARALAHSLDIPVVPGSSKILATLAEATAKASEIGYPVMLKAAAGGGGRGLRVVEYERDMAEGFARCRSEAM